MKPDSQSPLPTIQPKDLADTKKAIDWLLQFCYVKQQAKFGHPKEKQPETREEFIAKRNKQWKFLERVFCLMARFKEHLESIQPVDRPPLLSKEEFYRRADNAKGVAAKSVRDILKKSASVDLPPLPKSIETAKYRKGLKEYLQTNSCSHPKKCNAKVDGCDCPDLAEYINVD